MSKLKLHFVDDYKIKPYATVMREYNQWYDDIRNGDDTAVRLTDIVMNTCKPKDTKNIGSGSYVYKVQGYRTILITRDGVSVTGIYSPLLESFIGCRIGLTMYRASNPMPTHSTPPPALYVKANSLDPLDEDLSKRLLVAGDFDNAFTHLCMSQRRVNSAKYICIHTGIDDPLLAVVNYINSVIPKDKRDNLMKNFDKYGAIDTIVGDALTHIDKFRSF